MSLHLGGSLNTRLCSHSAQELASCSSLCPVEQRLRRAPTQPLRAYRSVGLVVAAAQAVEQVGRLRLNNIAPQPGSRPKHKRKGRGYGAGQGATCGFGMRGQNSRSGSGTRPGFEGGQTPLYRQLPKLRGIAGGMSAGVPKFVTVNLQQLGAFAETDEVTLEALMDRNILNTSGREAKLPLKILGDGELSTPLTIKAAKFSASAMEKIEKAGGTAVVLPQKEVWTKALGKARKAEKEAAAGPAKKPARRPAKKA